MRVHACRLMHSNSNVDASAAPVTDKSAPTPSIPEEPVSEEPVLEEPVHDQTVGTTSFTFVYDVDEEEEVATGNDDCNLIDFQSEVLMPGTDLPIPPEIE